MSVSQFTKRGGPRDVNVCVMMAYEFDGWLVWITWMDDPTLQGIGVSDVGAGEDPKVGGSKND